MLFTAWIFHGSATIAPHKRLQSQFATHCIVCEYIDTHTRDRDCIMNTAVYRSGGKKEQLKCVGDNDGSEWRYTTSIHRCHRFMRWVFFLLAVTSCVELLLSICQPSNVTGSQTEARTINKRIHDGAESQCHAFAYGIRLYIFHSTILIPNSLHTADTLRDIHTESQRYTQ